MTAVLNKHVHLTGVVSLVDIVAQTARQEAAETRSMAHHDFYRDLWMEGARRAEILGALGQTMPIL